MSHRRIPLLSIPWVVLLTLSIPGLAPAETPGPAEIELPGPLLGYPTPEELEPPPAAAAAAPSFEAQVVDMVNQERWSNGQLPPLKLTATLASAAETHSANMASRNFFAHCDLDTRTSPRDRARAAGYPSGFVGENIAAGQPTPQSVMTSWMNSTGHRNNILSTGFTELGVGHVFDPADSGPVRLDLDGDCVGEQNFSALYHYWTQKFGRSGTFPVVIEREAPLVEDRRVALYVYGTGWAVDMRIRNENRPWSQWMPYASNVDWTLSPGSGAKTVTVEIRSGFMSVLSHSDTIQLEDSSTEILIDGFESGNLQRWDDP